MADPIQIQAPDNSIIEFPAGTSDDTIKSVMARHYPSSAAPQASSGSLGDKIQSFREAVNAPTRLLENGFMMGLGDRARALIGAGVDAATGNGFDYSKHLADEQGQTEQFKTDHPVAAPIIQGVGGAAAPLGALGAAAKGASLGGKVMYGSLAGAGIGGAQAGLESKDWTNLPQVGHDVALGTGTGFVLGGALPLAAKGIGAAYNGIANAVRPTPGISRSAVPHLLDAYKADGPAAIRAQLDNLGPDATLADAGPALLGKAQGASLNSDEGRSILQGALTQRNVNTNSRIMSDVNGALGPAEDPQTVTNAIREYRTKVDNAAYPAALDNAPPVKTAPILQQLDVMIPRSVGMEKKALTNLRDMMMTTKKTPVLDVAGNPTYDANGFQKFTNAPVSQNNADVLHKVKQELDNVIQYDAPGLGVPAGALTRQQGTLKLMRGQLNNALETQVPGYKAANAASAALAKRADAVELGTQYLGSGKTTASPDRFATAFEPLSQGEKIAFAKGSRGNIDRILGTKANDLQALRGELQGEGGWNTAKIATVHGQDAADQLVNTVDRNLKFRDTYNKVVENSQTAQRQAAASAMKPTPASETPLVNPNMTLTGLGGTAAKKAVVGIGNALLRRDPTRSFGEVARVLSAHGKQRDAYHDALVSALGRRQANAAASSRVGDNAALAAFLAANGYLHGRSAAQSNRK